MLRRKIIYSGMSLLFILVAILGWLIFKASPKDLTVNFLDVGQGDAILISCGQNQILIDGGPSGQKIMEKLGRYIPFWDRKIEAILITHPDSDHIGGLVEVFKNYEVGVVIGTEVTASSAVYANLQELIHSRAVEKAAGQQGMKIKFDEDRLLEILSLQSAITSEQKETNAQSLVTKLALKNDRFLFTGDLPMEKENELMAMQVDLSANVLKIAHHGSKYSTSSEWLNRVNPQEAIISVGKNSYGHPAPEILERLKNKKINIWRTDEQGDIRYECQANTEKCLRIAN